MKRRGFKYMIIGFLFALLDIHLFIDVLPDPVGYVLIASGIVKLAAGRPNAKKAEITAYIMMVLSIPTFFFSGEVLQQMQSESIGWQSLGIVVSIGHLILVYFIFHMLLHEVEYLLDAEELHSRIRKMMIIYMSIALSSAFLQPFLLNMEEGIALRLGIGILMLMLIVHIAFLVHLRGLQKTFPTAIGQQIQST